MHSRLRCLFLSVLILLACCFVPFAKATIDTRYFRSDTALVNGLTTEQLLTSQSGVAGTREKYFSDPEASHIKAQWGSRVWLRDSEGSETEVTSGACVAIVSRLQNGEGIQSLVWSCPETAATETDSVVVRVYARVQLTFKPATYSNWQQFDAWQTEQLGATQLDANTWTFYYYTKLTVQAFPRIWYYWFKFDTATYVSRITGFSYTVPSAAEWNNVAEWEFSMKSRDWNNVALWSENLSVRDWLDVASWSHSISARDWLDVALWSETVISRGWLDVAVWSQSIVSRGWQDVAYWSETVISRGWQDVASLSILFSQVSAYVPEVWKLALPLFSSSVSILDLMNSLSKHLENFLFYQKVTGVFTMFFDNTNSSGCDMEVSLLYSVEPLGLEGSDTFLLCHNTTLLKVYEVEIPMSSVKKTVYFVNVTVLYTDLEGLKYIDYDNRLLVVNNHYFGVWLLMVLSPIIAVAVFLDDHFRRKAKKKLTQTIRRLDLD